jgi:hypothetical protein
MATKAEQIVDHFTQDPAIKADILSAIAELQGNPGAANIDQLIARFTSDPDLTAKIKEIIARVGAGDSHASIAADQLTDSRAATAASEGISGHKAVVQHILKS